MLFGLVVNGCSIVAPHFCPRLTVSCNRARASCSDFLLVLRRNDTENTATTLKCSRKLHSPDKVRSVSLSFSTSTGCSGFCDPVWLRLPERVTKFLIVSWAWFLMALLSFLGQTHGPLTCAIHAHGFFFLFLFLFVATLKVARLTLQTRKHWLVDVATVPRVTFDLPEFKPPKNKMYKKSKMKRNKKNQKNQKIKKINK